MSNINPVTPEYSQARPVENDGCVGCDTGNNQNFYTPATAGNSTELFEGTQIDITDQSITGVDRFTVAHVPIVSLGVVLSLVAKVSTSPQSFPILKGTTVDEVNLTWVYTPNSVASQTLTNDGALTPPTLGTGDRAHDYTSQTITDDVDFTIDGDDGLGNGDDSTDSDIKGVTNSWKHA